MLNLSAEMTQKHGRPRFEDLTETTDVPVSAEAASMMYTRYRFARRWVGDARVLEVGCGPGHGFGLLREAARSIVGGDVSRELLLRGRRHYGSEVSFIQLSAEDLPFSDGAFDVVLCYEATYYIEDSNRAFDEIARVLRTGGVALFVNANPSRPDFIESPHSIRYHDAASFRTELRAKGFDTEVKGAFPAVPRRRAGRTGIISAFRRVMRALGLVPKTLKGRARIKRLLYRRLMTIPAELHDGFATEADVLDVDSYPDCHFKVLYVSAVKST